MTVARAVGVGLVVALLCAGGCVLPIGDPCCAADADCADGARCFEGACALRCNDDAECDEGSVCVEPSGVCRVADPQDPALSRCPGSASTTSAGRR